MNPLSREIRLLLSCLNQFIQKMPVAKASKAQMSIKDLISVPDPNSGEALKKVIKNLQYKYNFLKIAYPGIIPEKPSPEEAEKKAEEETDMKHVQLKFDYNLYWNHLMSKEDSPTTLNPQEKSSSQEEPPKNNPKIGKFIMKDGKLVPGESERRSLVDFSNWVAAHVDPEDLKKHRELLDRQHFRGPVWEGKKIPPSILDEKNPIFNMDVEPEINPNFVKPKEEVFEKVKR